MFTSLPWRVWPHSAVATTSAFSGRSFTGKTHGDFLKECVGEEQDARTAGGDEQTNGRAFRQL